MATTPQKTIDLDGIIGYEGEDEDRHFTTVKLLGEEFRVLQGINIFSALAVMGEDSASMQKMLLNMIHGQDRARFNSLIQRSSYLVGEEAMDRLVNLFNAVAEVASGERPTKRSSGSGSTTKSRAAGKSSAGRALPAASR